jgi:hypothetical protein
VSSQRDSRVQQRRGLLAPSPTSYECYQEARERYFERLRVDSEIRRLERMWRLPEATPRPIRADGRPT